MYRTDFLFKHLKQGKILDIGNLGMKAKIHTDLLKHFPESEIHGLDIEEQSKYNFNFSNQKVGNVENMLYEDNTFDTIYLGEVLEHTWMPKKMIEECFRVLKPQGILILDSPNVYALSRMMRYFVLGQDIILGNPDHKIFFSRAMLDNLFKQIGFEVAEITSDSKITIKSRTFKLPRLGSFAYMGEHILAAARKL